MITIGRTALVNGFSIKDVTFVHVSATRREFDLNYDGNGYHASCACAQQDRHAPSLALLGAHANACASGSTQIGPTSANRAPSSSSICGNLLALSQERPTLGPRVGERI